VVAREDYERWLFPEPLPDDALEDILSPPPPTLLESYEVSQRVNSVNNDGPELIEPSPGPDPGRRGGQQSLF
jgi:putative SOS response-associated peptidase YedK